MTPSARPARARADAGRAGPYWPVPGRCLPSGDILGNEKGKGEPLKAPAAPRL